MGTTQGNTSKFVTYAGFAPATGDCAKFDANGNLVTSGAACGGGSGGGSVVYDLKDFTPSGWVWSTYRSTRQVRLGSFSAAAFYRQLRLRLQVAATVPAYCM